MTTTTIIDEKYGNLPLNEILIHARKLWLSASNDSDLMEVESLYRYALRTNQQEKDKVKRRKIDKKDFDISDDDKNNEGEEDLVGTFQVTSDNDDEEEDDDVALQNNKHGNSLTNSKKREKRNLEKSQNANASPTRRLKPSESKKACEKLALLLCQSGRSKKAKALLTRMGYVCRLSKSVLDYDKYDDNDDEPTQYTANTTTSKHKGKEDTPPCCILDHFITKCEIDALRSIFESTTANYWMSHNYAVEPPSPYFSYIIPLKDCISKKYGFIGEIVNKIYHSDILRLKFPKLKEATKVELWAHNRPHSSGHQMHFDSDDEGRDGVRNPVISTIIYITTDCGGPSLVTNQKLNDNHLATKGWLCYPKCERLVAFDGRYLHGVIPGKGVQRGRRVTLMLAFWFDIKIRKAEGPGSARPFPEDLKEGLIEWADKLVSPTSILFRDKKGINDDTNQNESVVEADPICIDRVYETLGGKKWSKSKGFPEYDSVFQGF